ncbi:MAG: lysozyme [Pseudomonadota bacterium]
MDKKLILALAIGAAIIWYENQGSNSDPQDEDLVDSTMTKIDQAAALISGPGPIADMSMSAAGLRMLRNREACYLKAYNLGDGGWTIGWGHYSKSKPDDITQDQADAMFADDVVNRGEKWVKLYVTVDLTQEQFDALTSIAFNMSPQSFKKFADSVNAGNGIDDIAQASVGWVDPKFTNGIQNRRNTEMNLFDNGVYS